MEEEVKILTEETGCSEDLARSILIDTNGNLNLAFKRIATESKHFLIVKGKFALPEIYNSGIFILILNTSKKRIHRLAVTVVSSPFLFEEEINTNWYDVERKVYVERLSEVSRRDISNQIEQEIILSIKRNKRFYSIFDEGEYTKIELKEFLSRIFKEVTFQNKIFIELEYERISLKNLKGLNEKEEEIETNRENIVFVSLKLSLPKENLFKIPKISIEKLKAGENIFVCITDERDIGIHLSRLLGGRTGSKIVPIPATVEEKIEKKNGYLLKLRFTPQISGEIFVEKGKRLSIYRKSYKNKSLFLFIFLFLLLIGVVFIFYDNLHF